LHQIDNFNYLLSKELFDISLNINTRIEESKELVRFWRDYLYQISREIMVTILLHEDNLHIKNRKTSEELLFNSNYRVYDNSRFRGKSIDELKSLLIKT